MTLAFFAPFAEIQTPADRAFALASVKAAGDLGRELADLAVLMFGADLSRTMLVLFADNLALSLPDLFPDWAGMQDEDRTYLQRIATVVFDRRLALHRTAPARFGGAA